MPMTNVGLNAVCSAAFGAAAQFAESNLAVGVSTNNAAFNPADAALGGTEYYQPVTGGSLVVAAPSVSMTAAFAPEVANFTWNCWGIRGNNILLNRVVEANGTKLNTQTWSIDITVTFELR